MNALSRRSIFVCFVKALEGHEHFCEKAKEKIIMRISDFGCPGYVRISYCVDEEMISSSLKAFKELYDNFQIIF